MKLLELLYINLDEWPEGTIAISQSVDRWLAGFFCLNGEWIISEVDVVEWKAEDWEKAVVTYDQWLEAKEYKSKDTRYLP